MKKAAKLLLCLNLLVFTVLAFKIVTVRIMEMKEEGGFVSTQSENVESKTQSEAAEKKKVALTFDDGPDPEYTEMLLDGLKKRDVKATFFCWGNR